MQYKKWKKNNKIFLIENTTEYSYDSLYHAISQVEKSLKKLYSGQHNFIIESRNTFDSYVKFLAALKCGHNVLLCSIAQFKDKSYLAKVEKEAILDFSTWALNEKLPENKQFDDFEDFGVEESEESEDALWKQSTFIVRTSGSSGDNFKLILHSPELFKFKYEKIGIHFKRTFAFSPAESIAGIETLLEVLTHELTLISSADDLAPSKVAQLIQSHAVDYFQTTPTFMNLMILAGQVNQTILQSLKKIAYGSEPSQDYVVKYFMKNFPSLEMVHTYGMTEIGIQKTITNKNDPAAFCLDQKYNESRVVNGTLEVKSMTKMLKYLNAQEVPSSLGPDWFNTGDEVVQLNEYIKVLGRHGDLINIAGRKFFPSELENQIRDLEGVVDVTITTEKNEMIGTVIIATIVIQPQVDEMEFRLSFKKHCESKIISYMHPHKIKIKRELDHTPRMKKMRKL